ESRGGSPTARGKRVPGVEINVQIVQAIKIDKLDFHRVCLQSEGMAVMPSLFCMVVTNLRCQSMAEIDFYTFFMHFYIGYIVMKIIQWS
ncbi:hypothetical protein M3699_27455, partial [Peribacillus simplex]|uniref:hypothetical protein n=1 Tax=Peribacillus simplex TaxID=1478 RepID=UPI002041A05C